MRVTFLALGLLAAVAGADPATAELVAEAESVPPGAKIRVGVRFVLEPHWHVYWRNPGDSGQPPSIRWKLPEGVTASEIEWPVPDRIPTPPYMTFGYEKEVLLSAELSVPAGYAAPTLPIAADVEWLVCNPEMCVPGEAKLSVEIAVRPGEAPKRPMMVGLPMPAGLVSARYEGESILVQAPEAPFFFFPADPGVIEAAAEQPSSGRGILLTPAKGRKEPVKVLRGVLTFVSSPAWNVEVFVMPAPVPGSRLIWIVPVAMVLVVLFFARRMFADRKERAA
jgi:thiol:disulfide interchange protein DsbD